ncbi:septal ring lytic transglycosylase RlpA family protein [Faecalibacter rhinopitheci]|uniref:Probable endolytic peptidoglycan transglycosylase RlpA n=1 Tax=Faecalibacter rhinopitheci TaxID=2779678 RepID=A0A8J7FME9_9FLAO|nr:septal ring lytic transglycosylase RlpA family protein [Faecalibacter rhinopitheci]MBF0596685.1 septal ring lytic transglycosylase RlpA family protein [Faecalibacter rhinopitheci]
MSKNILALVTMLMIFPIANADGKILRGATADAIDQESTIVPSFNERFNNQIDDDSVNGDSVKENKLSIKDEKEIEEILEKAAIASASSGVVSWYGDKFHGRKTASGEAYDKNELTAAHKTLPFGTKVKVTNIRNGKSVVVEINDRGPFVKSRVLDLSQAAFSEIGHTNSGVMQVKYEVLESED